MSFGGPEIRDGVCLVQEEEDEMGYDQVDGGSDTCCYLVEPSNGRLSLTHSGLSLGPPGRVVDRNWHWVTTLDLSYNCIGSV